MRDYVGQNGQSQHEVTDTKLRQTRAGTKISRVVFAIDQINLGTTTRRFWDGWTVVTLDGKPSAHAEHTIAITEEGPEVLTLVAPGVVLEVSEPVGKGSLVSPG